MEGEIGKNQRKWQNSPEGRHFYGLVLQRRETRQQSSRLFAK
jgi:hypothetical protein